MAACESWVLCRKKYFKSQVSVTESAENAQ